MSAGGMNNPNFWLRMWQMVFGIIAFATVADWADWSRFGYVVFVGVSSTVVCLIFMGMYVKGVEFPVMVSMLIDGLWCLFWLIAAALVSDTLNGWGQAPGKLKASVAFSWLTWFGWVLSLVVDFMARRSGGVTGPAPPAMPTGPAV